MKRLSLFVLVALFSAAAVAEESNLLQNPAFDYHCFENHRLGQREDFSSHNVAFWNTEAWGDITVVRESHVDPAIRPPFTTHNMVSIAPGKRLSQFFTLPEAGLAHGDSVSLHVYGHQASAKALKASVKVMKLDSEDGAWKPADFGMGDDRTYPKHSRGELVAAKSYETVADAVGAIELKVEAAEIIGHFREGNESHSDNVNTIGIAVEFQNAGAEGDVWVYAPSLCRSKTAIPRLASSREMVPYYRYMPRTMQKLWKGDAIHILAMGSSIDRGSANPPMYFYDENPASPTFKQPLAQGDFESARVGRPDLDGYVGWWQHYFSYTGRLRLELMRKFNLPVSKICLNYMACDGSCVGEAHSGLAEYCALSQQPEPGVNGQKAGTQWRDLYPDLFTRPEGPGPDLVIFGSGANEKTDKPDEVAVFEGMIRWIQRHYPNTEFLFCMFQNHGEYTPNTGDLQALALRYQIPHIDFGRVADELTRWCNRYAFVPSDGHPQAAGHYVWFKQIEKAFECWDPIQPGQAQLQLPERLHPNSYGWEGEMVTYDANSGRLIGGKVVFEDTAVNCWGVADEGEPVPYVDGAEHDARRGMADRSVRNSLFRHGNCRLGDRHILELKGTNARLTCVDAKICPNRQFLPVDNARWNRGDIQIGEFASQWGSPYGNKQVVVQPGQGIEIDVAATDVSVAYVDAADSGKLKVLVDGAERLVQPANQPFVDIEGQQRFMENRKGILGLPFGLHAVRIEAVDAPVTILGLYTYDSRSNQDVERRLTGQAVPGETVTFSLPFKARPVVLCHGGLKVATVDTTNTSVRFSGDGPGTYEMIGE